MKKYKWNEFCGLELFVSVMESSIARRRSTRMSRIRHRQGASKLSISKDTIRTVEQWLEFDQPGLASEIDFAHVRRRRRKTTEEIPLADADQLGGQYLRDLNDENCYLRPSVPDELLDD